MWRARTAAVLHGGPAAIRHHTPSDPRTSAALPPIGHPRASTSDSNKPALTKEQVLISQLYLPLGQLAARCPEIQPSSEQPLVSRPRRTPGARASTPSTPSPPRSTVPTNELKDVRFSDNAPVPISASGHDDTPEVSPARFAAALSMSWAALDAYRQRIRRHNVELATVQGTAGQAEGGAKRSMLSVMDSPQAFLRLMIRDHGCVVSPLLAFQKVTSHTDCEEPQQVEDLSKQTAATVAEDARAKAEETEKERRLQELRQEKERVQRLLKAKRDAKRKGSAASAFEAKHYGGTQQQPAVAAPRPDQDLSHSRGPSGSHDKSDRAVVEAAPRGHTFVARRPIRTGMFLLSVPVTALIIADPPPLPEGGSDLDQFFLDLEDAMARLLSSLVLPSDPSHAYAVFLRKYAEVPENLPYIPTEEEFAEWQRQMDEFEDLHGRSPSDAASHDSVCHGWSSPGGLQSSAELSKQSDTAQPSPPGPSSASAQSHETPRERKRRLKGRETKSTFMDRYATPTTADTQSRSLTGAPAVPAVPSKPELQASRTAPSEASDVGPAMPRLNSGHQSFPLMGDDAARVLHAVFHADILPSPRCPALAGVKKADLRWAASVVLSRRLGGRLMAPLVDMLNHSAAPNAFYTLSGGNDTMAPDSAGSSEEGQSAGELSAVSGLDYFDNLLAGVPDSKLTVPHMHLFATRDIQPGEPVTLSYSDADPQTAAGLAVWTAMWGFVPERRSEAPVEALSELAAVVARKRVLTCHELFPDPGVRRQ